jgi:hypothetical protein
MKQDRCASEDFEIYHSQTSNIRSHFRPPALLEVMCKRSQFECLFILSRVFVFPSLNTCTALDHALL